MSSLILWRLVIISLEEAGKYTHKTWHYGCARARMYKCLSATATRERIFDSNNQSVGQPRPL